MIIAYETAKNAMSVISEYFHDYLYNHMIELDPNDESAMKWLTNHTNEFTRLVFPPLCKVIGIDGLEKEEE